MQQIQWQPVLKTKILALILLLLFWPAPGRAQTDAYQLDVLQIDEKSLILELRLLDFELAAQQHAGVTYERLSVPGLFPLTEPGQPQLPGLGKLLGTPPDGVAGINILEQESETISDIHLWPTPTLVYPDPETAPVEMFTLDETLYDQDTFFPNNPAEIGMRGKLRDQPVAQIRLIPFQYNPLQQMLKIYRRLRVQIIFAPPPLGAQAAPSETRPDTPYERMLQKSLLNYAHLPPRGAAVQVAPSPEISAQSQGPALKIFIEEDGLYQVTYDDLQNAGFDPEQFDPRHLQMANKGSPVAIYVHGETDGVFDPADWLEFYGLAEQSEFTRRNVYWLAVANTPGLRMAERMATPGGTGAEPAAFYAQHHFEKNRVYWQQLPNGVGKDHWFWKRFKPAPDDWTYTIQLQNIANIEANGLVRVTLHGRTSIAAIAPDHHTQIFLNDKLIDEQWWDGERPFVHEVTVSQQRFRGGNNTLRIKTPGDTGAGVDSLYLDHFDIGYWDSYVAENDELYFTAPAVGVHTLTVHNFSRPTISVYDISDPQRVGRLVNGLIEDEANTYRVQVEDETTANSRYLALTENRKRAPAGLLLDTPSNLKSPDSSADYLIITHQQFTEAAQRLANYRAGQGLRVMTVQITDIYDEFSYGLFTPQAIRDFLSYAYHTWTPPQPLYVLLLGDANYDYQDYLQTGNPNYLPTHLFESNIIGQTSTDNWFVSVSGDDFLPDMFIGRLSVQNLAEAHAVVDKIVAYEQTPFPTAWQQQALFVADDEAGFEAISGRLAAYLPPNYTPAFIHGSAYKDPLKATADIIETIDQGVLVANYVGHGSVTGWYWQSKRIFDEKVTDQLNNAPRYPFLITGNCNNGLFSHPQIAASLAEKFINTADKGGIAAWSPTGLGYAFWHEQIIESLYQVLFQDYSYQLGAATTTAKIEAFAQLGWREPVELFTLFGDPALTLKVVQPRLILTNDTVTSHVWPGQLLTYRLTYTNYGNEPAENVTLTQIYDAYTSYQSAQPPPTEGNNVWRLGSVPVGTSGIISVTVQVSSVVPPGTTISSQVTLESKGYEPIVLSLSNSVAQSHYLPLILRL